MSQAQENTTESIERYYLHPGYIYASSNKAFISTVLGSCVSVCLWDSRNKYGGMNHFIYPKTNDHVRNGRFGNVAAPYLIKLMMELGSRKEDLVAHIVGGANNPVIKTNIGKKNIEMAEKVLSKHNIKVSIRDIGGQTGRKLVFNTETGEILVNKGAAIREGDWYK